MAFFAVLKNSLKQKWLQYFQSNRFWISLHSGTVATPDGGKRPASYLILGVINVLEPQLTELMLPFSKLNPNVEALIDVLGLNFDPDLMLGNKSPSIIEVEQENQQVQVNDFLGSNLDAFSANDAVVVISEAESLGGGSSVPKAFQEEDAFTVTSLDEITLPEIEEENFDDNSVVVNFSDEVGTLFLDVGNFELTSSSQSVTEEKQAQDAQDISGLFPNF